MKVDRRTIEQFLRDHGWTRHRVQGSHSAWRKEGRERPAIVDLNYDDVPENHIRTILRAMNLDRKALRKYLRSNR